MQSCSEPACMSVVSICPPMPIHAAEKVSTTEGVTVGTVQEPFIPSTCGRGNKLLEETAYPDQSRLINVVVCSDLRNGLTAEESMVNDDRSRISHRVTMKTMLVLHLLLGRCILVAPTFSERVNAILI